jgi:hypothetical protein
VDPSPIFFFSQVLGSELWSSAEKQSFSSGAVSHL